MQSIPKEVGGFLNNDDVTCKCGTEPQSMEHLLRRFQYVYLATLLVFKKDKNETLTRQTLGVTDLKLGMHTQLNSGSNTGWVPPGHTSSFWYARLKNAKNGISEKHFDLGS